jgi:hypothetical protein
MSKIKNFRYGGRGCDGGGGGGEEVGREWGRRRGGGRRKYVEMACSAVSSEAGGSALRSVFKQWDSERRQERIHRTSKVKKVTVELFLLLLVVLFNYDHGFLVLRSSLKEHVKRTLSTTLPPGVSNDNPTSILINH